MVLATDLDGTFLGGVSSHKEHLYRLISENEKVQLVFVTGRGVESIVPLLNDPSIPIPDFIIADVGATVINGHTLEAVEPIQSEIEKKWPGNIQVLNAVAKVEGIVYQEVPQTRRVSFLVNDEKPVKEVRQIVSQWNCEVIYSAGRFLDILPKGVNKGSTLTALIHHLGIEKDEVLVAGDTLNDLSMYQCGFRGVVVGDPEPKLVAATRDMDHVFHAPAAGTGGILEALVHWQMMPSATASR